MLFIFDWDGTISDSTGKIVDCLQRAATDIGLPTLAAEAALDIIGLGLPEAFQRLFPDADSEQYDRLKDTYSQYFVAADQTPSAFFPGVMDTLEKLQVEGHQLAVATGKSRRGLDRVFRNLQLQNFFHSSRCADETASKPHPQMLYELLAECGASKESTVMVGDTEYDMEMALKAQVPRIAVSYGAHHIDRLRTYKPTLCIDSFSELLFWQESYHGQK